MTLFQSHHRSRAAAASATAHLRLPAEIAKLDRFDLLLLDDFGYVRRDQTESTVLFELIAERYERKSIADVTSILYVRRKATRAKREPRGPVRDKVCEPVSVDSSEPTRASSGRARTPRR